MKKFSYKMQGILNLKLKLEEQEKNNYAIVKARLTEEQEKLNSIVIKKQRYEQMLRDAMNERLNIKKMRQLKEGIESLKQLIKQQTAVVHKAEQAVELAMQKLKVAMVERKTHEKLRETALDQYLVEYGANEKKEIDELVSFQHSVKDTAPI